MTWLQFIFRFVTALIFLPAASFFVPAGGFAQEAFKDSRIDMLRDADHYDLKLEPVKSLSQWEARKKLLRETVLLRAGFWPEPEKTPLNARVFDVKKGDGFTVAKVYFESLPGFMVTGNLYFPAKGTPPYPAVITPHGHWQYGRLQNSVDCSIPGRCMDFARMGFVALSLDMVGYDDSMQLPHNPTSSHASLSADVPLPYENRLFRGDFDFPEAELYGFTLGGLQLWNNIRGLDFLTSLPEVDPSRIGCTGESGGATQTILLMTADDRIKVAAPVNIVGARKQPGCRCENIPGLWLDTSTVELSAAFAPRPLLLMSATEDPWTNSTPTREYPILKKYYSLYNAEDMIKNVHITGGHNYNAQTRAAVYEWFCSHLKSQFPPIADPVSVPPEVKALGDLRVFPDLMLPKNAVSGLDVIKNWKTASERQFASMLPKSPADIAGFAKIYREKLGLALAVEIPAQEEIASSSGEVKNLRSATFRSFTLSRKNKGDSVILESLNSGNLSAGNILLVLPESSGGLLSPDGRNITPWVQTLLKKGHRVWQVRGFASGLHSIPPKVYDSFSWSSAYNRDNRLNAVQDIITALTFITSTYPQRPLSVAGFGASGIETAFACALSGRADKVIADLNFADPGYDRELQSIFPEAGIKRAGDLRTAALLLMQKQLVLCNSGATFDKGWYEKMGKAVGVKGQFMMKNNKTVEELVELF